MGIVEQEIGDKVPGFRWLGLWQSGMGGSIAFENCVDCWKVRELTFKDGIQLQDALDMKAAIMTAITNRYGCHPQGRRSSQVAG